MPPISEILPYIVSAGGAYAWLTARRLRGIQQDSAWQQFYKGLVADMKVEIGEMKEEIYMLRQVVESYKETCDGCPNNKKKKT